MAKFVVSIGNPSFYVTKEITSTPCATIYVFTIVAEASDTINITLTGSHENEYYINNGVTNSFNDTTSVVWNKSLTLHFIIQNSGNPGVFDECELQIENATKGFTHIETVVREDDSDKCGSVTPVDYDGLSDTPGTKTGSALKYVRVNAAETAHEYVTPPGDKNYEHIESPASAVWTINHALGKFPSVTIIDSSNQEVEGEVLHVDNNNVTITFSAAFTGKAYLN